MEYERIIKEALLTDGKIIELLRLEYGEEPKFTMNLKLLDVEDNMVYLPDALAYIAQAQLDKTLKTDGIEIRADNQFYPTLDCNWQEHYATFAELPKSVEAYEESVYGAFLAGLKTQLEGMKKAGFVKVIPKGRCRNEISR